MRLGWRIAAIWSIAAFLSASQTLIGIRAEGTPHQWWRVFSVGFAHWLPWGLATLWTLPLAQRYWPRPGRRFSPVALHLANWLAISILSALWAAWLNLEFQPFRRSGAFLGFVREFRVLWHNGAFLSIITYAAILSIGRGLDNWYTASRLRADLSEAELRALRSQLEPHFLFNALHSIAGLVRDQRNQEAVSMIAGLSGLLRQVLDSQPHQLVPLREELEFARQYLDIQQMRFADRLLVHWNIEEAAKSALVPHLILQPLLENAVRHGTGHIRLSASRDAAQLHIQIENAGQLPPRSASGVGLAATEKRLATLYSGAASFTLASVPAGVRAELRIPLS